MKLNSSEFMNLCTSIVTALTGVVALFFISSQLEQLNKFKRFENYVHFNKVYDDWYHTMPDKIKLANIIGKVEWEDLTNVERSWVRRYFDLYAQEYFFYQQNMIPTEMWEELIDGKVDRPGAVLINLREYPILVEGYHKWKAMGAFDHPPGFITMVDEKIKDLRLE